MSVKEAIRILSANDPVLAECIAKYPSPAFTPHTNYYDELVGSIVSQQLSVKAASTIFKRFCELFGSDKVPAPEKILAVDVEQLRAVGLSRPKAGYIQDLAAKVLAEEIRFKEFDQLSNDEIVKELTAVKGIGEWTAHMFLMFCMGRLDVLPAGDLGIKNGVTKLYEFDHQATAEDIQSIAERNNWHPYESVASWYIWKSLDNAPK